MAKTGNPTYVSTDAALATLAAELRGADLLAIDTEFIRERTYWARLCLIQVSDGKTAAVVDPFTVEDFSPLWDIFFDPKVLKVLHAGDQDLEIIWKMTGKVPSPLFDTQVAAALASFPLQAGYGLLVGELLGHELDKTDSYTDWQRRPLSERQIRYALDDVMYLPEIYRQLRTQLERAGRLEWLDADFQELADPSRYEVVPEEMYRRVKRRTRLRRRAMGVLQHLAAWREREAMRRDVPRGRVLGDEALVQIAARQPTTRDELARIRGVSENVVKRDSTGLIAAVEAGLAMPEDELPLVPRRTGGREDVDAATDLMSALVRTRAQEYGIAVPVLASRKEMEALARGEREDSALLTGWRRAHIGLELVELLEGRLSLAIEEGEVAVRNGEPA